LLVKLEHAEKREYIFHRYARKGFLDGHGIDFVCGKVAFDLEWNSKEQIYDRDLHAFMLFQPPTARGQLVSESYWIILARADARTRRKSLAYIFAYFVFV